MILIKNGEELIETHEELYTALHSEYVFDGCTIVLNGMVLYEMKNGTWSQPQILLT